MKIEVGENSEIIVKEVYNGITLETNSKEKIFICMRDSGFEVNYGGKNYNFKNGEVEQSSCSIICECCLNGCVYNKMDLIE